MHKMIEHHKSEKLQNSQWGKKSIIEFSINSAHFLKLLLCFWFVSVNFNCCPQHQSTEMRLDSV